MHSRFGAQSRTGFSPLIRPFTAGLSTDEFTGSHYHTMMRPCSFLSDCRLSIFQSDNFRSTRSLVVGKDSSLPWLSNMAGSMQLSLKRYGISSWALGGAVLSTSIWWKRHEVKIITAEYSFLSPCRALKGLRGQMRLHRPKALLNCKTQ